MTPQELKNSILQLAIQGKLVEQRPEEGTGEELYKQIQVEKARLIKEGKIKKEKPLPPISEDEIPFEIPECWKWVRLNSVISLLSGSDLTPDKYNGQKNGIPYITGASNINNNTLIINRWTEYPNNIAHKGDLLLSCKGTVGKMTVLHEDAVHIARQIMAITSFCDTTFLQNFLETQINNLQKKAKSMIPGIERNNVLLLCIPLPSLSEQKRIVAKIEELLPLVEQYEKAYNRLEQLNKQFPDDMKKSILQMAMQGKLVEQRPEEGTGEGLYKQIQAEKARLIKEGKIKKEKPLPPISEDDIPFEIPDSWKWVTVSDFFNVKSALRIHQTDWKTNGIPFFRGRELVQLIKTGNVDFEVFVSEELYEEKRTKGGVPQKDDILITAVGTIGKTYIVKGTKKFYYKDAYILCLENYGNVFPVYIKYVLDSPYLQTIIHRGSMATTVAQLTIEKTKQLLIPIPPLKEMRRIVAKIEELLPLVDMLKSR